MGTKADKDPNNPFAKLDIKRFPHERKTSAPVKKGSAHTAQKSPRPSQSTEDGEDLDAALFLQAVGPVQGLNREKVSTLAHTTGEETDISDNSYIPLDKDMKATTAVTPPAVHAAPAARAGVSLHNDGLAQELARRLEAHPLPQKTPAPKQSPKPETQQDRTLSPLMASAVGLANPDDDSSVFFRAVADVAPLAGKGRAVAPEPAPAPVPPVMPANPLQDIVDGKVEFALSGTDEFMEGHVVGLDLMIVGKLQARQYSPEAHIDLHGLNSEQAFQHLVGFFRNAYHKGVRTALVVTGRGHNSPNGVPVLRFKVQQWFTQEPFRRVVLAFCTAKREDGGPGALYVLLRKYRKNSGKVRWDVMPTDPDLFL